MTVPSNRILRRAAMRGGRVGSIASVVALLAACGSSGGGGSSSSSASGATELKVGVLADLSGACQGTGPSIVDGAQIAADNANAAGLTIGGKSYKITLVTEDTGSTNTTAVAATNKLIQDEGVKFILGPTCSSFQLNGVAPVTAKAGVFYLNNFPVPDLGDPTKAVAATQQYPYVYLDSPRTPDAAAGYVSGIPHFFPNAKKVYYLLDNVGAPLIPLEKAYFDQLGISYTGEKYDVSATDFTPVLARAKAAHPDVLVYGVTEQPSLAILKQALALDVSPAYYTTNGSCCDDPLKNATGSAIGKDWAGLAFPNSMDHPTSPTVQKLADALTKKNGKLRSEDSFAVVGYDQMNLLIQAMQAAGQTGSVAAVSKALDTGTFNLIEGGSSVHFDKGHAPTTSSQDICLVQGGTVKCENLAYPPSGFKSPELVGG